MKFECGFSNGVHDSPTFVSSPYRYASFSDSDVRRKVVEIGESGLSRREALNRVTELYDLSANAYRPYVSPEFIRGTVFDSPEFGRFIQRRMLEARDDVSFYLKFIDLCALTTDDKHLLVGKNHGFSWSKRNMVLKFQSSLAANPRVSAENAVRRSLELPSVKVVNTLLHNHGLEVEWFVRKNVYDEHDYSFEDRVIFNVKSGGHKADGNSFYANLKEFISSPCVDANVIDACLGVDVDSVSYLLDSSFLNAGLVFAGVRSYLQKSGDAGQLGSHQLVKAFKWFENSDDLGLVASALDRLVLEGRNVFDYLSVQKVREVIRWLNVREFSDPDNVAKVFLPTMLEGALASRSLPPLMVKLDDVLEGGAA